MLRLERQFINMTKQRQKTGPLLITIEYVAYSQIATHANYFLVYHKCTKLAKSPPDFATNS